LQQEFENKNAHKMKKHPPLTTEHGKEFYKGATRFLNPNIRRVPRFDYQNLPDTERLSYELLTWDNFKNFLTLFENESTSMGGRREISVISPQYFTLHPLLLPNHHIVLDFRPRIQQS
jgi:hypothetical protein